ncbi:hypothetical protein J7E45_08405 [Microbacterium sp. ISL-59]|uniref:hypothetical protein n=1 Tax=Microbacterium sp. ISL-59 TaxID=2819159 RepID=UPI001BEB8C88|nr:hypothetical protein [Microbacterium sp. ISL-59]MBT2495627.1 hypothetical protein [Microbacterium sp. ISL-59]
MTSSRVTLRENASWVLSDGVLEVTVDPLRGADIRSIRYLPRAVEMLWSPEGMPNPVAGAGLRSGSEAFYDDYRGGIQELFPNAGPDCVVEGAPLVFHGESCRIPWVVDAQEDADGAFLRCRAALRRYPFIAERRISLRDGAIVVIESTVTNASPHDLPVHWGFHPVFSEALTEEPAVLLGDFSGLVADPSPFGRVQSWDVGTAVPTEERHGATALLLEPGNRGSADLGYATAHGGWYVVASESSGLAVGVTWPIDIFPRLWVWQECRDPAGYPWWGRHHIVGVEPHTAAPSRALTEDVAAGQALMIGPGESRRAEFRIQIADLAERAIDDFVRSTADSSGSRKKEIA